VAIACPACGKENGEAETGACARCGCDLRRLRAVSRCADERLAQAAERLRARDWPGALRRAEESWRLRHTPEAARLAFLAAAASGATRKAALWLARG